MSRPVDVLVNNAGLQHVAPLEDFPIDRWEFLVQVMLIGVARLTKAVLPGMRERRLRPHRQHRVDPFAGRQPVQERLRRGEARPGRFLESDRARNRDTDITINTICPTYVKDPAGGQADRGPGAHARHPRDAVVREVMLKPMPKGVFITFEELAGIAAFLISRPRATSPGTRSRSTAAGRCSRTSRMPSLLIADDHPLFRAALRSAAADAVADLDVREADSLDSVLARLDAEPGIDLVLLDLHMPGNHGLAGTGGDPRAASGRGGRRGVGERRSRGVRRALDHGAAGYLPKSTGLDDLRGAIRSVLALRTMVAAGLRSAVDGAPSARRRALAAKLASLSPQQFRVLALVAAGPAQQADRRSPGRAGTHGQGAPDVDLRTPRRAQPHAGERDPARTRTQ
jgi:DNA-binding NarL/FixJ family response regulator